MPSHVAPETPGSIHEGGELGYSLTHAFGAAFDNPDLVVACVVGDGEAETGPLATSWHSNKFLDPVARRRGAADPAPQRLQDRRTPRCSRASARTSSTRFFEGHGWTPYLVAGDDPALVHQQLAATLDHALDEIRRLQQRRGQSRRRDPPALADDRAAHAQGMDRARVRRRPSRRRYAGAHIRCRSPECATNPEHLALLDAWMRSYRPDELFDENGAPQPFVVDWLPKGAQRMCANPHANGGVLLRDLDLPDFRDYAVEIERNGRTEAEATRVLGLFLRDVFRANEPLRNFRLFGPDETASNRLDAVYEATDKVWQGDILPVDEHLSRHGPRDGDPQRARRAKAGSRATCSRAATGFFSLLRGFHAHHRFDVQPAREVARNRAQARRGGAASPSLNFLLTSHVWRQDHNGFTHQDPGFLDVVVNKKASVVRIYLPSDANCLLSVADHCLRTRDYVNVIVAGKQPQLTWLSMDDAELHCTRGHRDLGMGEHGRTRRARRRDGVRG